MSNRILLVDDEEDLCNFIGQRLEANGYKVTRAVHGADALEKIKKEAPDLILTDVIMPVMDGVDFYQHLKDDPATRRIPVMIMSAKGTLAEHFRKLDIVDFIEKPIEDQALLDKVIKCLGKVSLAQQSPQPQQGGPEPNPDELAKFRKVLVVTEPGRAARKIEKIMARNSFHAVILSQETDVLKKAEEIKPVLVVVDVFFNDKPSKGVVKTLKKAREFKQVPIVAFSYIDKDVSSDLVKHQKRIGIEKGKASCLEAGAAKYIGEFDAGTFMAEVQEFLN